MKLIKLLTIIILAFLSRSAIGQDYWALYTNTNHITSMAAQGSIVWCGTERGGIVRWDMTDGSYTVYTTRDGISTNRIKTVFIDSEGNIWFGTDGEGLLQYNGSTWESYKTWGIINAITEDKEGNIWYGTEGHGVVRFNKSHTETTYGVDQGLAGNWVRSIAVDKDNIIWAGTSDGVSIFDGTEWVTIDNVEGLSDLNISSIAIDSFGNKWIAGGSRIFYYNGSSWTKFTSEDGVVGGSSIAFDEDNKVWISGYGVCCYDGESWTVYKNSNGLISNSVNSIVVDEENVKYFGTRYGISAFDDYTFTTFRTSGPTGYPNAVAIDSIDIVWFCTDEDITSYDGHDWTYYKLREGWMTEVVSIAVDQENVKWIGSRRGIFCSNGSQWTHYPPGDGPVNELVVNVAVDSENVKWFTYRPTSLPYDGEGVTSYDGEKWITYTSTDGLPSSRINDVAVDKNNVKWFASDDKGVFSFDGEIWQVFNTDNGLANNTVNTIAIDKFNIKWFGTNNGISTFDGEYWTTYQTVELPEESPPDDIYNLYSIQLIRIDREDVLWIYLSGRGILLYDGITWEWLSRPDFCNLIGITIRDFTFDKDNNAWFTDYSGILFHANTITHVEDLIKSPTPFVIHQCFPNPFNLSTTISFTLPDENHIILEIYNVTGQKVTTMVDGTMDAGTHNVLFDGTGLPSGIYFYQLESSGHTTTAKMLLMK